jgi:DNA modification methylase
VSTQLTLRGAEQWSLLPSPKLRASDNLGVYGWAPVYSAFSERFAVQAIELMAVGRQGAVVLDPFAGGGTSLLAAARIGLPAVGVDLDPFAALLSRARLATRAEPKRVRALLAAAPNGQQHGGAEIVGDLFRPSDVRFAQSVISGVRSVFPSHNTLAALLDDPTGAYDSESVALAALCLGASASAKVVRGSNPVWYRRALPDETSRRRSLQLETRSAAHGMLADLASLGGSLKLRNTRIFNEDARAPTLKPASVDIVLTSPPYLNRLDYVVNHLAPLAILIGIVPFSLESLRRDMIGTTKMVDKGDVSARWGELCTVFLGKVAAHPSKASATYYYWNYYKYFKDIFRVLEQLRVLVRPGGTGAIVIQNSFYKEVVVPTPAIMVQMALGLGIHADIARTEIVRSHLGTMSPRQTKYVPKKVLEECILRLAFP